MRRLRRDCRERRASSATVDMKALLIVLSGALGRVFTTYLFVPASAYRGCRRHETAAKTARTATVVCVRACRLNLDYSVTKRRVMCDEACRVVFLCTFSFRNKY